MVAPAVVGALISGGASILGGLLSKKPKQQSGVLNWKDFNRHQDQQDQANPREINRQRAFLEGLAPTESRIYNQQQDATYGEDTRRQQERMDTLYAGTSPWERLGSNAATPMAADVGGNTQPNQQGQILASLAATEAQMKNTQVQAQTAKQTAAISALGNLAGSTMQRQTGKETTTNQAEQVKIQQKLMAGQTERWLDLTKTERAKLVQESLKTVASLAPREELKTLPGPISRVDSKAATGISQALLSNNYVHFDHGGHQKGNLDRIIQGMSDPALNKLRNSLVRLLGQGAHIVEKGGDAAGALIGTGENIGSFLKSLVK